MYPFMYQIKIRKKCLDKIIITPLSLLGNFKILDNPFLRYLGPESLKISIVSDPQILIKVCLTIG